jgi:hypothetical protein
MVGKIIMLMWATRGAEPKDRPAIIKALAKMTRWWDRSGRR